LRKAERAKKVKAFLDASRLQTEAREKLEVAEGVSSIELHVEGIVAVINRKKHKINYSELR